MQPLHYTYLKEKKTVISYDIVVEGLREIDGSPLPRQNNFDVLQVRCLIDGTAYRYSSGHAINYMVEPDTFVKLSSSFIADVAVGNHTLTMQWKKSGQRVEKWVVKTGAQANAFSFTAQADHEETWHSHETTDVFIYTSNVWQPLSKSLSIELKSDSNIVIGYTVTVQPQLLSFMKDSSMEYVTSRIVLNGSPYSEGAATFGANGWNPTSGVLKGNIRVRLPAGNHSVMLEWRKVGKVFKGWGSNPTFLDGFAFSRNLFAFTEKFAAPSYTAHSRKILQSSGEWTTVGDSSLNFKLVKESAVLFKYALPVTQFENPNLDSNLWARWRKWRRGF